MKKILLINAIYYSDMDSPHLGQMILRDILCEYYDVECINFDYLNKQKIISYSEKYQDNIHLMGDYILSKCPDAVGFYTISNAFFSIISIAQYIKKVCPLGITDLQLHKFMPLPGTKETARVFEKLYVDERTIEATLNNYSFEDIKDIITKYKAAFTQYYTFDSEVRNLYPRFDLFIEVMSSLSDFFKGTLKFLVKQYGFITIYRRIETNLEDLFIESQNREITDRVSVDKRKRLARIYKAASDFLESEIKKQKSILFSSIFKYDYNKMKCYIDNKQTVTILKFEINIRTAIQTYDIKPECYYVKYTQIGDKVYTTHVIPRACHSII